MCRSRAPRGLVALPTSLFRVWHVACSSCRGGSTRISQLAGRLSRMANAIVVALNTRR